MKITWGAVVRTYREPGLFTRADRALDADIDLDGDRVRALLAEAASARLLAHAPGAVFTALELTIVPDGERRHACLFAPLAKDAAGDPRTVHLSGRAQPAGAVEEADWDLLEWRVRFEGDGWPRVLSEERRPGRRAAHERVRSEAAPLRTRLDRLREASTAGAAPILWRGACGSTLALKRRPLLAALAEMLTDMAPPLAAEALALALALEAGAEATLSQPGWLPALAARKGSLARLAASFRCARCATDMDPASLVERRFDTRQGGLWGEAGVLFACPAAHEVVRFLDPS